MSLKSVVDDLQVVAPPLAQVDAAERVTDGIDPPFVEVIIDRVAHQQLVAGSVIVQMTRGEELNIGPIGAEIISLKSAAGRIDPPVVQMMIDSVVDQNVGPAIGAEFSSPDESDVIPRRAQIDSLKVIVGIDPPIVQVLIVEIGDQKVRHPRAVVREIAVRDAGNTCPILPDIGAGQLPIA